MASVAVRASMVRVTGMWKAASRALDSISVRHAAALGQHALNQ